MNKILILLTIITLSSLCAYANDNNSMNKMLKSWYDGNINQVIEKWGQPTNVNNENGKTQYEWEQETVQSIPNISLDSVYSSKNNSPAENNLRYSNYKDTSFTRKLFCTRKLYTDNAGKILYGQFEGNNCPVTNLGVKKWINVK